MFYVKLMNHRKALFNKHFKNSNKKWKKVDALTKKNVISRETNFELS